ncbi:hypothetical protein [uncultured Cyclobacterium sp.]|uniref:hypothetical protein n=1 Tax=uncultured Cyclobacterium sp. TaxID=453820 RepID=UPI0030ED4F3A
METFQNLIKTNLSGRRVLGLFILTNAVYIFMLTITIPQTMAFSGGMDLLDMMLLIAYVTKVPEKGVKILHLYNIKQRQDFVLIG